MTHESPEILSGERVVAYALIDASVDYVEQRRFFVDDEPLGRVPRLAICDEAASGNALLLHCDEAWNVLGAEVFKSKAEAMSSASTAYPGIESRWVEMEATEIQRVSVLGDESGDMACSFCGKRPREVDSMLEGKSAFICNECAKKFLAEKDSG